MSGPLGLGKYRGCLLGLAIGDALGTALDSKPAGSFEPVHDLVGGGPFQLEPGQWTDDTAMALCLATSLIDQRGFDPVDQMRRYLRWYREGYLSSTGTCIDIGNTVRSALHRFEATGEPFSGSKDPRSAGNGSLMRLAPVPMFFAADPRTAIERAAESSRTTHGSEEAVDACRYMAGLIIGALQGRPKDELLGNAFTPAAGLWGKSPISPRVRDVASGSFKTKAPPDIRGTGYVVESLEAALWAFHGARVFREGALLAVNLGGDADSTGAIYGQLAGAYFGEEGIPRRWRGRVARRDLIISLADGLHAMATVRLLV